MHRILFSTTGFADTEKALAQSGGVGGRALAEYMRMEIQNHGGSTDPSEPVRGGWRFYGFIADAEYVFVTLTRPVDGPGGERIGSVTINKHMGLIGRFFSRARMEPDSPVTGLLATYLDGRLDVEDVTIET